MEIVTHGGLRLWVLRFGEQGAASSKVLCQDANGNKLMIGFSDIKETYTCYTMPPKVEHKVSYDGTTI